MNEERREQTAPAGTPGVEVLSGGLLREQVGAIIEGSEAESTETGGVHPARRQLDREMREIKDNVLRMGSMVAEQIRAALKALVEHDTDGATTVIVNDGRINEVQRSITSLITMAIATQNPVARDLRFLLALDHVAYELERIGDHAGSVAKQARKLAPEPPLKRYVDLPQMGEICAQQVHGVLRALVDIDEVLARRVAQRDDEIDALYHRTFDEVLDLMRS